MSVTSLRRRWVNAFEIRNSLRANSPLEGGKGGADVLTTPYIPPFTPLKGGITSPYSTELTRRVGLRGRKENHQTGKKI